MRFPFRMIIGSVVIPILFNLCTVGAGYASPGEASADSRTSLPLKRLVVLDFELTGDAGGIRLTGEQGQRLRAASAKLRDELKRNQLYDVVDDASASAVVERWRSEQNLHRCNGCELDMVKQVNAEQVLVPWVFRMSELVLTMHVEIRDAATGRNVLKKALDFRGDNDTGWTRAIAYLIRDMKERRVKP